MDISRAAKELFRKILPAAFLVLCTVLALVWFLSYARDSYRSGQLEPRFKREGSSYVEKNTPSAVDIETWMTFDYVNVVYKIPSTYLSNTLGISDSRYPNLRIDAYAKARGIDPNALAGQIRQAIAAVSLHQ